MKIIYFTTTGNSLDAARRFGCEVSGVVRYLSAGIYGVTDDEAIGIVSPVYFGVLPAPVAEWLGRAELHAPYLFAVLTCGTTPGVATRELLRLNRFDYVRSVHTVDNYFPMFDVEKQVRNLWKKRVDEHLDSIVSDVEARVRRLERPSFFGRIAAWWMRLFPLSPQAYRRFWVDEEKCTQCGVCRLVCPIDNIRMGPYPEVGERCLTCGACRHNCPAGALRYRGEKSTYAYRNRNVTLRDIILSNDSESHLS